MTTVKEHTLLISSDSHVNEPHDLWVQRLPSKFRDTAPLFPSRAEGHRSDHPGGFNPKERKNEMHRDGVSGEIIYPTLALTMFKMTDPALQRASFRIYNEWVHQYCRETDAWVHPVGVISTYNIRHAVAELEWCHAQGFAGGMIWQTPPEGYSFLSPHYDPLWDAAQSMNMPISVHTLTGFNDSADRSYDNDIEISRSSVNTKTSELADTMFDFIYSGTFERFPTLKIVLVESGIGWMPFLMNRWDHSFDNFQSTRNLPITRRPSEYFRQNIYATFLDDPVGAHMLRIWGQDNCMWSSDYPQSSSHWPHSADLVEQTLGGLPPDTYRKVVQDNVLKLYKLPVPQK